MAKWIAAGKVKAGLRYSVVVCPNMTGRTTDRISQSKRVRPGSLVIIVALPQLIGADLYPPGVFFWFSDAI